MLEEYNVKRFSQKPTNVHHLSSYVLWFVTEVVLIIKNGEIYRGHKKL